MISMLGCRPSPMTTSPAPRRRTASSPTPGSRARSRWVQCHNIYHQGAAMMTSLNYIT